MANWKSDALACPRGAAEAVFVEKHKSFETFEFREPYQICGVQSFGEKRDFRRKMTRLCRFGVRSLNEESLLLLGLIADKIARRIHLFGKAGGAREIRTRGTVKSRSCPMFAGLPLPTALYQVVPGQMVGLAPLVATRWRFFNAEKAAPKGGFRIKADKSASYWVAGQDLNL